MKINNKTGRIIKVLIKFKDEKYNLIRTMEENWVEVLSGIPEEIVLQEIK